MNFYKKNHNPIKWLRSRLQSLVVGLLFPVGDGDWYVKKGYGKKEDGTKPTSQEAFDDFVKQQKSDDGRFTNDFKGLKLSLGMVDSQLTTQSKCSIEMLTCEPQASHLVGGGKHIVYFPGANTYYQACFRDISAAAKETGATVHAFNFPGTGASTGKIREVNDLINAGIAVVNKLIRDGVHPDNIILQGDCYGAAVALEVKKQFEFKKIKLRIIMNNAFKSFKSVVVSMISKKSKFLTALTNRIIKKLLKFIGWHISPGKQFKRSGIYQCYIQHQGDQTLIGITLSDKVKKFQDLEKADISTKENNSKILSEEIRIRNIMETSNFCHVQVKKDAKKRLGEKFGYDKNGEVNAHFADLCECETQDGGSVYEVVVNKYLSLSDEYIKRHPQEIDLQTCSLPSFLGQASYGRISEEEKIKFELIANTMEENNPTSPMSLLKR